MMKKIVFLFFLAITWAKAQTPSEKDALKFNLNEAGSHYIQATLLNQTWIRFNQSNPGTLVEGEARENTFDIGLRRTRFQFFGQISDRVFVYFQFGQNNFNAQFNTGSNRKLAPFFHDAVCEYRFSPKNQLKVGAGLTITNGLSRFSQPSIATIMTMDVPVFAQTTVDQIDEFSRKLSLYARGQIGKLDYRIVLSDPFPISSAGIALPPISLDANFAQLRHRVQAQGYFIYQFLEHEPHHTPYMTGTYLGKKKVFNLAFGGIFQKDASWLLNSENDTIFQNMRHFAVESYLDMPLHATDGSAISAYAGYFNTDYGRNYLRYNGIMNPANGSSLNATNSITGRGPTQGNALPMFGTGDVIYVQLGYLFPDKFLNHQGKLMPYVAGTFAKYDKLNSLWTNTFNAGINYFVKGHKSKFSIDWQNRPTYSVLNGDIISGNRRNTVVLQYQISF
ncbi:MAG: hypothetical protein NW226_02745 [Microscillaceae bacterium]|nr:hypothetical protein [Microscillaceae bacterium]